MLQKKTAIAGAIFMGTVACASLSMTLPALAISDLPTRVFSASSQSIEATPQSSMNVRIADRLSRRINRTFGITPPIASVRKAVEQRQNLLARSVEVTLPLEGQSVEQASIVWSLTLAEHTDWIEFSVTNSTADFRINDDAVAAHFAAGLPLGLPQVEDAVMTGLEKDKYGISRTTVSVQPKAGYEFVDNEGMASIVSALRSGNSTATVPLRYRSGRITREDGSVLELLATGTSDYRTSPWGRQANIKKAIEQHVHNVVIPAGEPLSFNATLGAPITKGNGWADSLIIVNGSSLEPAPGGGICQAATTVYRAAVLAGLPMIKRAPHSLYVHYYEMYGLGLDATIFPGRQDLAFQNDTPGDIVIQASVEGTGVTVEFYGLHDGRTVAMQGPFVSSGETPGFSRAIRSNEIGWLQSITKADGSTETRQIISAYGKMPRTTALKVAASPEAQPMHGSAPQDVALQY